MIGIYEQLTIVLGANSFRVSRTESNRIVASFGSVASQCFLHVCSRYSKFSAILAGVTPALKAARAAFSFPSGNEEASTRARGWPLLTFSELRSSSTAVANRSSC
jgi:hypothetical protein